MIELNQRSTQNRLHVKGEGMVKYVVFIVLLTLSLWAKETPMELIRPLMKSVLNESYVSVVVKVDTTFKNAQLQISVGEKIETLNIHSKRDVYCKTMTLVPGENLLHVKLIQEGKVVKNDQVIVFYHEEIYPSVGQPPIEFSKKFFHHPKQEALCQRCHKMDSALQNITLNGKVNVKAEGVNLTEVLNNPEESNCFECHKNLISKKNAHAPSVNLICTQCHTGEVGEYNAEFKGLSRFVQPDPISTQCFACHENVESEWLAREFTHGPAMNGRCTRCHNPHSSEEIFFTKKPIWDLCTTCHSEKATEKHVVSSFVFGRNKGAHPTKGPKDPAREGREFVCSSCHNPHGSNGIFLLRMEGRRTFELCKRCHEK